MRYAVDLNTHTIAEAWESEPLDAFRNVLRHACPGCDDREDCLGGCPLVPEITLCGERQRVREGRDCGCDVWKCRGDHKGGGTRNVISIRKSPA